MKRITVVLGLMIVAAAGLAVGGDDADTKGVEAAVLDYVEGVYDADVERIKRSVHPELAKFGFAVFAEENSAI